MYLLDFYVTVVCGVTSMAKMGKGVHSAGWKEKMLEGIGNKQCK